MSNTLSAKCSGSAGTYVLPCNKCAVYPAVRQADAKGEGAGA